MAIEGITMEKSGLVVVPHKFICGLKNRKDILLSGIVEAWVIRMSDAQCLQHRLIPEKANKKRQNTLLLDHHLSGRDAKRMHSLGV